jgi:hypothetical protein
MEPWRIARLFSAIYVKTFLKPVFLAPLAPCRIALAKFALSA